MLSFFENHPKLYKFLKGAAYYVGSNLATYLIMFQADLVDIIGAQYSVFIAIGINAIAHFFGVSAKDVESK